MRKLRAVVYRMSVQNKLVTRTVDFARGDADVGAQQAFQDIVIAARAMGMDPTQDERDTFTRVEVWDPHVRETSHDEPLPRIGEG